MEEGSRGREKIRIEIRSSLQERRRRPTPTFRVESLLFSPRQSTRAWTLSRPQIASMGQILICSSLWDGIWDYAK